MGQTDDGLLLGLQQSSLSISPADSLGPLLAELTISRREEPEQVLKLARDFVHLSESRRHVWARLDKAFSHHEPVTVCGEGRHPWTSVTIAGDIRETVVVTAAVSTYVFVDCADLFFDCTSQRVV